MRLPLILAALLTIATTVHAAPVSTLHFSGYLDGGNQVDIGFLEVGTPFSAYVSWNQEWSLTDRPCVDHITDEHGFPFGVVNCGIHITYAGITYDAVPWYQGGLTVSSTGFSFGAEHQGGVYFTANAENGAGRMSIYQVGFEWGIAPFLSRRFIRRQHNYLVDMATQLIYCVIMIPAHANGGLLPAGIHSTTWAEFVFRFGVSARRQRLLAGLHAALVHLAEAGCQRVLVGGSFVTTKVNPKDVDVCWHTEGVEPDLLNPIFLSPQGRTATLALFGAEFYPHFLIEAGTELPFPEFFQRTRDGRVVGAVEIDLTTIE